MLSQYSAGAYVIGDTLEGSVDVLAAAGPRPQVALVTLNLAAHCKEKELAKAGGGKKTKVVWCSSGCRGPLYVLPLAGFIAPKLPDWSRNLKNHVTRDY